MVTRWVLAAAVYVAGGMVAVGVLTSVWWAMYFAFA